MKLLFLTSIPSPYRVAFFNELGKYVELTVLFERGSSAERDASWREYAFSHFTGVIMRGHATSKNTAFCPEVRKYLDKSWDHIICADATTPTGMLAIETMKRRKLDYWIEGDGAFAKSGKGVKERLKKRLLSGAKGYFSTSRAHDDYYLTYGASADRIYRYPFTSVRESDVLRYPTDRAEKDRLKNELGLSEEKILISVGRFSYQNGYGKGYDLLLKACEELPKNYGVYIIGDKPTDEFLAWKERSELSQVHFLDFKRKDELFRYYRAADLFVLLSRGEAWGLVINEAMANGLPVVTTERCVAGLELVRNGENGYIVPAEDVPATVEAIRSVMVADIYQMGERSLEIIRGYTIEAMAEAHVKILGGR